MTDVRIVTEPLGGSPLSRLLQTGGAPARWSPRTPISADEWRARATQRIRREDWTTLLGRLAPALDATGAAAKRIARVQREGGVVVTTGQQPGLFGGPVYTWSKAMSAIAFADALEDATGIATCPVFWAATDDADFAEASTTVFARVGGVDILRQRDAPAAGTPMSLATLGSMDGALHALRRAGGSASDPRPLEFALDAYGNPRRTIGRAFVELLRVLLAPLGMPVLDASHDAVAASSRPVLDAARARALRIEHALELRATELRAAGHEPQVLDVDGLSLVFVRDELVKRRLSVAEAPRAAGGTHTPNVLLRPIVEHAILPTVAYVAGPGELAYFAQVSAVADALSVDAPIAVPRWSCTLLEPHVETLMARYGVTAAELAAPDLLEGRIARRAMGTASTATLDQLRATIASLPAALAPESGPLGLMPAVEGAMQSLQHRVDRLERRLVAGIKHREVASMRDVGTLRGALFPTGVRQERALNPLPIFARHGLALLTEMHGAAAAHATSLIDPPRAASVAGTKP